MLCKTPALHRTKIFKPSLYWEAMKEKSKGSVSSQSDTIDIPVGKWLSAVRKNPWIIVSIVLVIVIVGMFFWWKPSATPQGIVAPQVAAANAVSFINAQGQGTVTLSGVTQKGPFYEVKVSFQGQEVPVFVSLDGNYVIANPIPITPNAPPLIQQQQQQAPSDARINVTVGDSPSKGNKEAKVTIVEFTDYECPYCEKFYNETYKQLVQEYIDTGKVQLVVKDFPLKIHEKAQKAAEAVHCAREQQGDQGYFRMHNKLFENQARLSIENYKKWAKDMDLVASKFDTCLDSGKYEQTVKDNLAYGQQLGVSVTPMYYVNGKPLRGAQPYATFKQVLDAELAAS